ncbi:type II toxin-antitoxin system RelE/ParE family toxin [Bradyrhizobium diazoefficiens]|nr:type II toxin-antitoxin system RelE/ParE family toxin [Bradyrhizobium diazoefficiens]MBR0930651.1 type II toxin-antitoxin system RelE/ParE family toxin [Bradyrhizobium diazoefficiens]
MKPLHWIGSSLKDLRDMPEGVRQEAGFAIHMAQKGDKAANAIPLVGFGSAKVLEVVIDDDGDTYRAVYTVKFAQAVYALHVFQKKAKKGIKTPLHDINLVKARLKAAELHYKENYEKTDQKEIAHDRGA